MYHFCSVYRTELVPWLPMDLGTSGMKTPDRAREILQTLGGIPTAKFCREWQRASSRQGAASRTDVGDAGAASG